jgi:hypothetical protein
MQVGVRGKKARVYKRLRAFQISLMWRSTARVLPLNFLGCGVYVRMCIFERPSLIRTIFPLKRVSIEKISISSSVFFSNSPHAFQPRFLSQSQLNCPRH